MLFRADAAVVEIVNVVLDAEPDASSAWEGLRLHVGASVSVPVPVNVTAQVKLTIPENPPAGESTMESVTDPPAELMVRELDDGASATVEPVPVIATVCGDALALSVIASVPVRNPPAVGVNVTDMAQLVPACRLDPQVFVSLKSPVTAMEVRFNVVEPLFVSVRL